MICVFGSFVIGDPLRVLKVFGLGLASANPHRRHPRAHGARSFGDELLADRNWWMPAWLDHHRPETWDVDGVDVEPPEDNDADVHGTDPVPVAG